ncbi:MAG: quinol:cytochrome C oxidoreductase [Flavobacteriia bacterium]|nr:quinol:cytochrome C oxidoreductase [Flavobacteriia bacterium]
MFQFTSKAKILAYVLIALGAVSLIIGFTSVPGDHHAEGHDTEMHADAGHGDAHAEDAHHDDAHHGEEHAEEGHGDTHAAAVDHGDLHDDHAAHDEHAAHADHALHQQQNRPWSAFLVNTIFFLAMGIGTIFFLMIQYVARAGWTVGMFRIFEAVGLFVAIPLIGMLVIIFAGVADVHHIWHWMADGIMDKGSKNYDSIIAGKAGYLNDTFFIIRAVVYAAVWFGVIYLVRKNSLKEDQEGGTKRYHKIFKIAAFFTVFYGVTSSTSAWDWIMSIDTHWFSTLFGWYTFAGMFVTALATLNLLVVFLRYNGYTPWLNENHQHDLAKFMFAFSIFWTYLWFSQFMLIWYSNIPEEVTYYMQRFGQYNTLFLIMVAMNFIAPVLLVMSRDSKRVMGLVSFTAVIVLVGHWLDHFIMIMPGSVGEYYGFGWAEIGGFMLYAGLFILVVFRNLANAPLLQKNHPMVVESKHFTL